MGEVPSPGQCPQTVQQTIPLLFGNTLARGLFRLAEKLPHPSTDLLGFFRERHDGILPVFTAFVAPDQSGVFHLPEDRRERRRIDQTTVRNLPLKRVRMAHQKIDHLRLAGQQFRILRQQPGKKPLLKQRVRRQKIVVQRMFHFPS